MLFHDVKSLRLYIELVAQPGRLKGKKSLLSYIVLKKLIIV